MAISDLPVGDRRSVAARSGADACVVLRSRDTQEYEIALDYDTAVLCFCLDRPQTLQAVLTRLSAEQRRQMAIRLVYDRVLQMECSDGSFADGVLAFEELLSESQTPVLHLATNELDPLSRRAIAHVMAVPSLSPVALARRLYASNATPRTAAWDRLLGGRGATARWLGLDSSARWREGLRRRYQEHGSTATDVPWFQWTRIGVDARSRMGHKLYVSVAPAELANVLPRVAEVCCAMEVPALKVGGTLLGVLRPDKLVVYLSDEPSLWQVVAELRAAIGVVEPHGVPFSTPVGDTGWLSWAIDPAEEVMLRPFGQPWSWRAAVAGRLGAAIAAARDHPSDDIVLAFALERLRVDGIEPIGWSSGADWSPT